jgi:hypothetical protein
MEENSEMGGGNGAETTIMEYYGWDFYEYPRYDRGRLWYAFMGLGGLALLIYAVLTANFLFAFIIIMFALILYLTTISEPARIRFGITSVGIRVGRTFYPYKDITRFWFIYEPPDVKNLYFELKTPLQSRLVVDLDGANPNEVRTVLGQFIREDLNEDDEPLSDFIGRVLKI